MTARVFAEVVLLRMKYAVMTDAARAHRRMSARRGRPLVLAP